MQIRCSGDSPVAIDAGAVVVPIFSDKKIDGPAGVADIALGGAMAKVLVDGEIDGKSGESVMLRDSAVKSHRVLALGLGDRKKLKASDLSKWAGTAVRLLGRRGITSIAFALPTEITECSHAAQFVVEGAIAATIDMTIYRTEQDRPIKLEEIVVLGQDQDAMTAGAERGRIIGEAVNFARRMALEPANTMTPTILAQNAKDTAAKWGIEIDVLDEARMKELGMEALLGVSQGSVQPATLTVFTYKGDPESSEILALVGKAITFDSGGISIKPAERMHEMKYDMCGGAAVIATLGAIGELKPKINILGVIPSSENLPGGSATKPGDVHRAMSGKTIEVLNTDAEGRLILSDAIAYAKQLGATRIIDCATLTGACVIALGHAASAAISNNDEFIDEFLKVANATTERYWRMPLYDDFKTAVKSEIADLRNVTGREAGTCTAAAFLAAFAEDTPWIHLDIAGTAYADDNGPGMAKGPTGTPVRAFVDFVMSQAK